MELKNQVCTLEQGKRLYELIEKDTESLFVHWLTIENEDYVWKIGTLNEAGNATESYPAYTVAELGEMLPDEYLKNFEFEGYVIPKSGKYTQSFETWFFNGDNGRQFGCRYDYNGNINIATPNFFGTEAQARAELLIYLLEQRLITPNQQK